MPTAQNQMFEQKFEHLEDNMEQKFEHLEYKIEEKFKNLKEVNDGIVQTVNKVSTSMENLRTLIEEKERKLSDPKDGVYIRLERLEIWKGGISKWLWLMAGTIVGLMGVVIKKFLIG